MTRQVKTKMSRIRGVMFSAPFNQGYREAREGLPMDYDAFTGDGQTNDRWQYERGRLFGILYSGPVKHGRRVARSAIDAMNDALYTQAIR